MTQSPTVTHYEVLDVPATADTSEIKKAYQRQLRSSHPDVGGSAGLFRLVQAAYDTLSDQQLRDAYDRSLRDTAAGSSGSNPPRQQERRARPRQDTSEANFRPMETPPPALAWHGPAVEFRPPLETPPSDGVKIRFPASSRIRMWRKVVLIIGAVVCLMPVISTLLAAVMYSRSDGLNPAVQSGIWSIVLTAGFWWLAAMTPWWIARRKQLPPATVLAGSILPERYINAQVHGTPGRDLSVARFGENARIGIEGEQRTARLIAESVLPGLPSARLINGLRWPGTEHADIDHAVIAGNRIALIDSKMWADGDYWWDNKRLFRNGKEMGAFRLGAAVHAMRIAYPTCYVEGWVVLHSPSGKLSRPSIERAGMLPPLGQAAVYLVDASELPGAVHQFLTDGDEAHTVEVPVLASLLYSML
ncbi:DnaJ domain-containing protein [Paeniglutamicibacter antarcticus]|uniref:DnaJ domain-containing protein n=1 Tax=Arthrobacter terrae TaxID=2935737 RepID=A0A931CN95_9MICC|nr:DnaJ domain-containing protein [Arthrobacter terrae]MBG0739041.1 DnaJ domain-containing protein [Arthrobacter terrae]